MEERAKAFDDAASRGVEAPARKKDGESGNDPPKGVKACTAEAADDEGRGWIFAVRAAGGDVVPPPGLVPPRVAAVAGHILADSGSDEHVCGETFAMEHGTLEEDPGGAKLSSIATFSTVL